MMAISAMNTSANGSNSGCAGRNPAARQKTKDNPVLDERDRGTAEGPPKHDFDPRTRRHQGFLQKAELAVP
jgi:hypothetical protein